MARSSDESEGLQRLAPVLSKIDELNTRYLAGLALLFCSLLTPPQTSTTSNCPSKLGRRLFNVDAGSVSLAMPLSSTAWQVRAMNVVFLCQFVISL